ncbi:hypothetical protein [Desulfofalx alkaliphila]|uniref:hypothetical protein n=1 Tax=Desulfofalx alkaliphila TaxID=105483 RepID=UPI000AFD6C9F|nr:hypothetical protein [Desulfofalx alkaliphila]
MAAQHKRPGRTARLERIRRVQERQKGQVKVIVYTKPKRAMDGVGRVVAIGDYIA